MPIHVLGVDVGTVVEGVVRRELTVSFEAQDVSNQRALRVEPESAEVSGVSSLRQHFSSLRHFFPHFDTRATPRKST